MNRMLALLIIVSVALAACGSEDPTPIPAPSPTPSPTSAVPPGVILQATINARVATETANVQAYRASVEAASTPTPTGTSTPTETPTRTSTPSHTPQPTMTPTPKATPFLAAVTRDANLREGPGTGYAIAGVLAAGESLQLIGQNEDGDWLLVLVDGNEAWIGRFLVDAANTTGLPLWPPIEPSATPAP